MREENAFDDIAVNGIRLTCPKTWRLTEFNGWHLMLVDNGAPRLELKWAEARKQKSLHVYLQRLQKQNKKKLKIDIGAGNIPDSWARALDRYESLGFSWENRYHSGMGFALRCSQCDTISLIQFHKKSGAAPGDEIPRILSSYRDHRDDGQVLWRVFGLRVLVPASMPLVSHRFEPGKIVLKFRKKKEQIAIYRWGPASVLLDRKDISGFAAETLPFQDIKPRQTKVNGFPGLEWQKDPGPSKIIQFGGFFNPVPAYHHTRLWHHKEKNKIMGVAVASCKSLDKQILNDICESYENE